MTVFLKYFSARFPLCTAQYQEHFTKCLLNEVNKCKTSVPHFKVGHIFVFFNKEVNSQHLCFCESNGVKCEQMGISKGMSFTQNGKEASYHEVPFPIHWQWACVHDKSFPSTQGMFILTYTFFFSTFHYPILTLTLWYCMHMQDGVGWVPSERTVYFQAG